MYNPFYYNSLPQGQQCAIARVNGIDSQGLCAAGTYNYRNIPLFAPKGYFARPSENDSILVVNADGAEAAAGVLMNTAGLERGEIKIISESGANIILKNDGSAVINGVIIKADGEIVCKKITATQGGA